MKPPRGYVIGIDGGGTRSRALAADLTGRILARAEGDALNYHTTSIDRFRASLAELLRRIRAALPPQSGPLLRLAVGAAALADFPSAEEKRRACEGVAPREQTTLIGDALAALKGAGGGAPCLLIVSGTGSIAARLDAAGRFALSGGLGPLIQGDPGSAFWIGAEAVAAAAREEARRGAPTPFSLAVREHFEADRLWDIPARIYHVEDGPRRVAALAGRLAQSEWADRPPFNRIQERAGELLAELAWPLLEGAEADAPIYAAGSTLENNPRVRQAAQRRLGELAGRPAPLRKPRLDAARGAVLWALEEAGVRLRPSLIERLAQPSP
ncbi:MAG: hypothetical protein J7M29_07355 [Verrucomicrobia bacterium]|nr:hypothetical protein [Verrucomicrobiota bacterium]